MLASVGAATPAHLTRHRPRCPMQPCCDNGVYEYSLTLWRALRRSTFLQRRRAGRGGSCGRLVAYKVRPNRSATITSTWSVRLVIHATNCCCTVVHQRTVGLLQLSPRPHDDACSWQLRVLYNFESGIARTAQLQHGASRRLCARSHRRCSPSPPLSFATTAFAASA